MRVKYSALGDDIESTWARMALPGAGPDAGMAFLPQVGDEVVVAFEHGDARRPIVLGALHNSIDKPHKKMAGDRDGGSLVVYGRKDAEINLQKQLVIDAKLQPSAIGTTVWPIGRVNAARATAPPAATSQGVLG